MSLICSTRHLTLKVCQRYSSISKTSSFLNKRLLSSSLSHLLRGDSAKYFTSRSFLSIGGLSLGLGLGYVGLQSSKLVGKGVIVLAEAPESEPDINVEGGLKAKEIFTPGSDDGGDPERKTIVSEEEVGPDAQLDLPPTSKSQGEEAFDWAQLMEIVSPYWKRLLVAVASAFAVAVINIQIPAFLGRLVDAVTSQLFAAGSTISISPEELVSKLKGPASKLVLLYIAQAVGTFSYIYNLSVIGEGMALELRTRLFESLLNQEVAFFDSHMTGEVVSRLTADIQEFKSSFKQCVSQGLRSISQTLGCVISLYFVSKEMTVTVVAVVPAIIVLGAMFTRGLRTLSRKSQMQLSESSGHAEETLSNIRTVKAFAMEEQELQKYREETEELRKLNVELGVGIGVFQGGSNLFLNGIVLGVMYTGGKLIAAQQLSSGDLMSFLVASQTIQRSLANMSLLFGQYVRGIGAGTRVFHYINLPKEAQSETKTRGVIPTSLEGDIEFRNASFSYPTRSQKLVLQDFTLKIPKGKVVAVVGASGSGKSTLVNILEGFYPLESGSVTIDGHAVETLDTKWLRGEAIGLINQEPILFATSIKENIRYGKPSATDEEVLDAAKRANAYEFVVDFPEGFETKLGERGVTVSGGQKQRIAIARALVKQPKILILDEATSALDADSEHIVQKALDSAVQGRTVLVIAHRLSTIKNADIIAVMSHGSIVEMGSHDSLMQRRGFYYSLIKQQEFLKTKAID